MRRCESILQEGLTTFFKVGQALLTIRENHLYRSVFPTFELYCMERWGIGRSYASRVIGAAERLKLLPFDEKVPRPANEFQIRPFLKLAAEEFPQAWNEAVLRANGRTVTSKLLSSVVGELCSHHGASRRTHKKSRKRSERPISLGRVLVLIQEAKQRLEKNELEEVLAALNSIEAMLFGSSEL
jgi:hypothetical protein